MIYHILKLLGLLKHIKHIMKANHVIKTINEYIGNTNCPIVSTWIVKPIHNSGRKSISNIVWDDKDIMLGGLTINFKDIYSIRIPVGNTNNLEIKTKDTTYLIMK